MFEGKPTLLQSYILATFTLRFSGLFPYTHHAKSNQFRLSYPLLFSTVLQLLIYIYVNFSLMLADWRDYAQPVASSSSLAVVGNLLLRLLGLMSTLLVLLPSLLGSRLLVNDINYQLGFKEIFFELGFNTYRLYRQIRLVNLTSWLILFIWISLNCWHAVHFYELLTNREASFFYYLVVILSDYYRLMFSFFLRIQLIALYLTSQQLNGFIKDLMKAEHGRYEQRRSAAIAWISNMK